MVKEKNKVVDEDKINRRRVLNAEAAKKCRLKKKEYIANLEEKFEGIAKTKSHMSYEFMTEYSTWLDEETQHVAQLKLATNQFNSSDDFGSIIDRTLTHFNRLYDIKKRASKMDVFNIMYRIEVIFVVYISECMQGNTVKVTKNAIIPWISGHRVVHRDHQIRSDVFILGQFILIDK